MLTNERVKYLTSAIVNAKTLDPANARYFYRSAISMLEVAQGTYDRTLWAQFFIALERVAEERGL
jgi:hypothetical protein